MKEKNKIIPVINIGVIAAVGALTVYANCFWKG